MDMIVIEDICESTNIQINYKLDPVVLLDVLNKIIKESSKMEERIELLEKRNEMLMNILSGSNISNIGDKIEEIENG